VIELAEEQKILPPAKPWIKALIASGVVAEFAPDRSRILRRIMAGDKSLPARRDQQRRQNPQNRRFPRAVRANHATASPSRASNVTPWSAGRVARSNGFTYAGIPMRGGG